MSGRLVKLGKSFKMRDGKLVKVHQFRDASHAIRAKKSKRVTVKRRTV